MDIWLRSVKSLEHRKSKHKFSTEKKTNFRPGPGIANPNLVLSKVVNDNNEV